MEIQLFPDEKLLRKIHPSRASFIRIYGVGLVLLLWSVVYYAAVNTAYWIKHVSADLAPVANLLTPVLGSTSDISAVFLWIVLTFFIAVLSTFLTRKHRHWLTFLAFILVLALSVVALRSVSLSRHDSILFLTLLTASSGFVALLVAEVYRRAYRYYITNLRIAMIRKFLTYNELYLRYENIVDVDVHVSVLGRIFSFGNILPITAAGVGTGENVSGKEFSGGSISVRGTDVPRALPSECFYGVKHPFAIRNTIAEYVTKSSSSYELKQIQAELKSRSPKTP